jgi:predicted transcriptional regulator
MAKTRYTIDLDEAFDAKLSDLAAKRSATKSDIIKRALSAYSVLSQYDTDVTKISIADRATDKLIKDVVFY